MTRALALVLLLAAPSPVLAHAAGGGAMSLQPGISGPILLALIVFGLGWVRLRARVSDGRGLERQGLMFLAGLAVAAGAALSPLHEAGRRSFTAHMLEHELLMLAAAPLLVLARPLPVMLWAFPQSVRRGLGGLARTRPLRAARRGLLDPGWATLLQAGALWLWHAPALFDRALVDEGWHVAQHLSFVVTALLFWAAVLDRRRSAGQAALCLFVTSLVSGGLGALMAVSESPWYQGYAALGLTPYGLTPAEDQQLAGALMWAPGGMVHAGAALALLAPMLRSREGRADARVR